MKFGPIICVCFTHSNIARIASHTLEIPLSKVFTTCVYMKMGKRTDVGSVSEGDDFIFGTWQGNKDINISTSSEET